MLDSIKGFYMDFWYWGQKADVMLTLGIYKKLQESEVKNGTEK